MKIKTKNSGFSLIELVIAIAVLSFLMLAVSSFMGSSVMHTKKAKVEVRLQAQAQETYSLITDTIMQASDIIIGGYTVSAADESKIDFRDVSKAGKDCGASLTKKYYVRDKDLADAIILSPRSYGILDAVSTSDFVYFKDLDPNTKIYVTFLRVESAVPIDIMQVPSSNPNANSQNLNNALTGEEVTVERKEVQTKNEAGVVTKTEMVYIKKDTQVSTFYFEGQNMYYGREYAFMTKLNDPVNMINDESKKQHLYSKYFASVVGSQGAVSKNISGCVATVNADDGTVGINLSYNKSSMIYETVGRVNTRNTHVLKPSK